MWEAAPAAECVLWLWRAFASRGSLPLGGSIYIPVGLFPRGRLPLRPNGCVAMARIREQGLASSANPHYFEREDSCHFAVIDSIFALNTMHL